MKVYISLLVIIILGFIWENHSLALQHNHSMSIKSQVDGYTQLEDSCEVASVTVYICTGSQSECYHSSSSCRGLKNCSASIKSVSIEKAKEMKRRPCKICYK